AATAVAARTPREGPASVASRAAPPRRGARSGGEPLIAAEHAPGAGVPPLPAAPRESSPSPSALGGAGACRCGPERFGVGELFPGLGIDIVAAATAGVALFEAAILRQDGTQQRLPQRHLL